jgi:threonylcarbamoyladenosine tRNA methylthiotransferase MtaB
LKQIRTASIATLGCKLNQSESDRMARQLSDAGVSIVQNGQPVDLFVVNSCTVTHIGDRKSRQLIRHAVRSNPEAFVLVTGCYAEMDPETVSAIEGVNAVLGNEGKERLVEALRGFGLEVGGSSHPVDQPEGRSTTLQLLCENKLGISQREMGHERSRAFVKIQEGCDNYCTYCIVPMARGHRRSRPAEDIVDEIKRLVLEGRQEIVLTGVNITAYGRDYGVKDEQPKDRSQGLRELVERILAETNVPRIRLTSLQPQDWSSNMYDLWNSGRLCRHLHLSLQSGSDTVLKRMRRRYNVDQYARIVAEAKKALPGVAITTDVIVGFPGETESEFLETEEFLRSISLAGFHVFKYSPREGTPAAKMPDQVDPKVKQERSDRLIALARESGEKFRASLIGSMLEVFWEERLTPDEARRLGLRSEGSVCWKGLSDNYVKVYAAEPEWIGGRITGAKVEKLSGDGVLAVL